MTEDNLMQTTSETTTQVGQEEMPFPMEGEDSMASNIIVFVMAVAIFGMLALNIKYTRKK
ncbi:MAG: hypothetical protein ACRCWY_09575 [Cellulosilyticaceae bacterium]